METINSFLPPLWDISTKDLKAWWHIERLQYNPWNTYKRYLYLLSWQLSAMETGLNVMTSSKPWAADSDPWPHTQLMGFNFNWLYVRISTFLIIWPSQLLITLFPFYIEHHFSDDSERKIPSLIKTVPKSVPELVHNHKPNSLMRSSSITAQVYSCRQLHFTLPYL